MSKDNILDYYYELYLKNIPVSKDKLRELSDNGYDIKEIVKPEVHRSPNKKVKKFNLKPKRDYTVLTAGEKKVESKTEFEIVDTPIEEARTEVVVEAGQENSNIVRKTFGTVSDSDWKPKSVIYHTKEFYDWIDSINSGFNNRKNYTPFNLYVQQCEDWLAENTFITDYTNKYDKIDFVTSEMIKCDMNTLYFANKYGWLQDPSDYSGRRRYVTGDDYTHAKIILYMIDCGYSFIMGKPRQIASTSTLGLAAVAKTIFKINHYLKFITENDKTGLEIFNDKIIYPYTQLPSWLKKTPINDREGLFKIPQQSSSETDKKSRKRGDSSRIEVVAPTKTAINGGSPQTVFIDEIGSIPILEEMMNEGRPTMFVKDKATAKLLQRRQVCLWGCVCAGTKVWNNNGYLVNIEDLNKEDGILGFNQETGKISKEEITYWQQPFEKPCYRITTTGGRALECSEDHPILVSDEKYKFYRINGKRFYDKKISFVETKYLKIGRQVCVIDEVNIFGNESINNARFIGWMIGDGNYGTTENTPRRQPRFYNCDAEINNFIDSNFDTTVFNQYKTKDGRDYKERVFRGITQDLKDLGIYGQSKDKKRLPININKYSQETICELLGGLFDTDGYIRVSGKTTIIDLSSISEEMLFEVKYLLHKLGIHSTVIRIKARIAENRKDKNDYFRLVVSDIESLIRFQEKIKLFIKYKQDRLNDIHKVCLNKKITGYSRSRSKNINGIRFEKITNIEYIGIKPVYNLTAGTTNTYIANGIVTHNTGTTAKGGAAFEKVWNRIMGLWNAKDENVGIVPLFFDWRSRCSEEHYYNEKMYYYGARSKDENMDVEASKIQFHQHYPSSPADMFVQTGKTLMNREEIENNIRRINSKLKEAQVDMEYGYFEPIYDFSKKVEGQDVPFKITGAKWVKTGYADERASSVIFEHPSSDWLYRYYAGTDPISSDTGVSKMSTVIWDEFLHTTSCVVNTREPNNPNFSFIQSMLATIYYDKQNNIGIPEIVERNIGLAYRNYRETKGFSRSLLITSEIDQYFQSGQPYDVGIDNRSHRAKQIINKLGEVLNLFGNKIYHEIIFQQLRNFTCTITRSGNEQWGSIDKRFYMDDTLFGLAYAFICAQSSRNTPKNINAESREQTTIKYKLDYDSNWNLIRVPIKTKITPKQNV